MNTQRAIIRASKAILGALAAVSWMFLPAVAGQAHKAIPPMQKKPPSKPGGGLGDGLTALRVRHILITDLRLDPSKVKVVSSSGTVALNGTVKTAQARQIAQSDAQKSPGVHRIINRLKVAP